MREYHSLTANTAIARTPAPLSPVKVPAFAALPSRFKIKESPIYPGLSSTSTSSRKATVDEEYRRYISASLSPPDTDILSFWEVSYQYLSSS
jgi:hypothetical protein